MELRKYQHEALDFFAERSRSIYADPAGSGKTATALTWASQVGGRTLILAPSDVVGQWVTESEQWTPDHTVINGSGGPAARSFARDSMLPIVMNYEAARADRSVLGDFDTVILDEAHRVKGRNTLTNKMVRAICRKSPNVLLITGTPIMNQPEELWSLLNLCDPKRFSSFWSWAHKHCEIERTDFWGKLPEPITMVKGLKPGAEVLIRLEAIDYLLMRHDVLGLPPLGEPTIVTVPLSEPERAMYDSMARRFWLEAGDRVVYASNEIAKMTRLRQLASDWGNIVPEVGIGTKVAATLKLIEDIGEQVVVLAGYHETVERIAADSDGVAYHGAMNTKQRHKALAAFKAGDVPVIAGTLATLGEGVDGLQVARHVILHDRDWTPARNEQAIARVRRLGQTGEVCHYHVVADNTIDNTVDRALADKRAVIDAITGCSPRAIASGQA